MRRPGGVRFTGWMVGLNAAGLCLSGVLFLFVLHPTPAQEQLLGMSPGALQVVGFVMLAIRPRVVLAIYALYDGSNGARIIVTVLTALSFVRGLVGALTHAPGAFVSWIQAVPAIGILIGLWGSPGATEFFRRPPADGRRAGSVGSPTRPVGRTPQPPRMPPPP